MFSKVIPIVGNAGSVEIKEAGGVATVKASLAKQAGGGDVQGFAKLSVDIELDVDAKQLIDAALELAMSKYPFAAGLLAAAKAGIDEELSKA